MHQHLWVQGPLELCRWHLYLRDATCVAFQCGEQVFNSTASCQSKDHTAFCWADGQGLLSTSVGQGRRPRAFLPFGSHPLVGGNVNGVRDCIVTDSQAQVCDGTHAIFLHQDVL